MHDLLGPLILFAAAMCLTPGPNVVMVTASAANFGFRRTIPQILGKGWVTTVGALAAFTTMGGDMLLQTSAIATVLAVAVACFASVVAWAGFGSAIARFLASRRARLAFNGSMAGLLVLSLVPVFV